MPEKQETHPTSTGGAAVARPSLDELAGLVAELSQAVTSLTLELEHVRHRVEILEHNARARE